MNNKPDRETLKRWHNDPDNWKWGTIYYNKEDKRLLPPKKMPGMGWTVNFANPWSILAMIVMLSAIFFIIGLIR